MNTALLKCLMIFLAMVVCARQIQAAESAKTVDVYFFWMQGCPHCEREMKVLQKVEKELPQAKVKYLEITGNRRNNALFSEMSSRLGIREPAVPLTVVGRRYWIGYSPEDGKAIRESIEACSAGKCEGGIETARSIEVPLLGEIEPASYSLPVLTVILGAADGFNPCAMWALIFLIGLLLGMKDSFRMWVLGSAFIAGSAAVYFLFMSAWLSLFLFIGRIEAVRIAIAFVALAGGIHYLREYRMNREASCAVIAPERRQKVFSRMKALALDRNFLVALFGILLLAFLVNLIELMCSAGIPAVYAQVLAMHRLQAWQHYVYMGLYILVFMADDLAVFVAAMLTLRVSGMTGKYARFSHLLGAAVLLIIAVLMLFRPQWLMLG